MERFRDRRAAGQRLAEALETFRGSDAVVLALPRGGVPVAAEVARRLGLPLDILLVRKLGAPGHAELAMGAVAQGGVVVRNEDVLRSMHIDDATFDRVATVKAREVAKRKRVFRGEAPMPDVAGRTVLLVDDGIATGSTAIAAVQAVRTMAPKRVVVAVPVLSPQARKRLEAMAEVVSLECREDFYAVGQWYEDFAQTSDDEVVRWLEEARPEAMA